MKAISLRAPWWWFVLHHGKVVENRSRIDGRAPSIVWHRGPLLLHASRWYDEQEIVATVRMVTKAAPDVRPRSLRDEPITLRPFRECRGGVIGKARGIGTVFPDGSWRLREGEEAPPEGFLAWHGEGAYGLILADIVALPFRSCRGHLGLFDLPDAYAEAA